MNKRGVLTSFRGVVSTNNTSPSKLGKYCAEQGWSPDDLSAEIAALSTSAQMEATASYEAQQEWLLMMEELASL